MLKFTCEVIKELKCKICTTVKSTFDKIEKVSRSIARKKKNHSIITSSVIFQLNLIHVAQMLVKLLTGTDIY